MTLNYKSVVGVDNVYYALISQDDASAYAAGTPAYLAPVMNISLAPAVNSKTQYADNQPFDTMVSEGETKLDVEVTGIPLETLATLLGRVFDGTNDRLFDNGGTPPDVALGFRSKKSDGEYRYYWFLKGKFSSPTEEVATQADTPDPKSTKLSFTAIRTIYQFDLGDINDSVKRVVGDTADAGFSETGWFDSVQVPSAGSPSALTCAPSPADGATSQAVSVAITLTFNNALTGGAEYGIGLLREDTEAPISVTRSIDAARKVVTLAHSNLTAAKKYLITVNGVRDVFGQTLADAVYDFETAA